jgi:dihydropteroate synthase
MGIINVTPDSFSGDGLGLDHRAAVRQGLRMIEEGADFLDIGGESTRPGHHPVAPEVELERVIPVVEELAATTRVPISIDTTKVEVAEAAARAGAAIINDVWGLRRTPELAAIAAARELGLVVMHNQEGTAYHDLMLEVAAGLQESVEKAVRAGVPRERVIVDPGIGFGKDWSQNLTLLRRLPELKALRQPLLVGTSRKSFIGRVLDLDVNQRLEGTAATVAAAVLRGADVVRVHDVRQMVRVARMADSLR